MDEQLWWTGPVESPRRCTVAAAALANSVAGGEGVVYRAYDEERGTAVALKLLTVVTIVDYARLVERASPFMSITHPNLMSQTDLFIGTALTHDLCPHIDDFDVMYSVADWIPGTALTDLDDTVATEELLRHVAGIARGVHVLHHYRSANAPRGIVHRDVKPSNVRIAVGGTAVLIDFGVARPLDDDDLTQGVGTYRWRAPEVLSGSAAVTTAVDVWGVGAIAYWTMAGQPPSLDGATTAREQLTHASRARQLTDPVGVAGHIATLLETSPSKRPTNLDRWANQLEILLSGRRRRAWRKPTTITAIAAFAIPGVVLLADFLPDRNADATITSGPSTDTATNGSGELSPQPTTEVPTTTDSTGAPSTTESGGRTIKIGDPEFVQFDQLGASQNTAVVVSALSEFIAIADASGIVRLWDPKTLTELGSTVVPGGVNLMALNGDGSLLATSGNVGTIRLWDTGTMTSIGAPIETGQSVTALAFNGAAEFVAGEPSVLASGGFDGSIRLWNPETAQMIVPPLVGHSGSVDSLSFDIGGSLLASVGADAAVRLWDPATGMPVGQPMVGHTGRITSVKFDLGGTVVVTASLDSTIRIWSPTLWIEIAEPLQLDADLGIGGVPTLALFSDGMSPQRIASVGGSTLAAWDLASGRKIASVDLPNGHVGDLAIGYTDPSDPQSFFVATVDFATGVDLWRLR